MLFSDLELKQKRTLLTTKTNLGLKQKGDSNDDQYESKFTTKKVSTDE